MCTLYKAGSHLWARYSHSTPLAPSPTHLSPDIAVHPWRKGVQNRAQLRTTDLGGVRNAHSEVTKICSEFPSKEIPYWSFSFFFLSCFFSSVSCSFSFKSYPGIFFFFVSIFQEGVHPFQCVTIMQCYKNTDKHISKQSDLATL